MTQGRPASAALRPEDEFGSWEAHGRRLGIQYSLKALEEVRRAVVDGFLAFPRGGLEVGGVLYGFRESNVVWVAASRPLVCEHAFGPAFLLSEKDEAALRELLKAPDRDPQLSRLRPVGWYHSHTRSGILLSEPDIEIYNRFFPEPWQIALVLRPENGEPMRAGFFVREEDGSVRGESGAPEFDLVPLPEAPAPMPTNASPEPPPPVPRSPGSEVREAAPLVRPMPAPALRAPPPIEPEAGRGRSVWKLIAGALLAVLVGMGFYGGLDWRKESRPSDVALRALDVDGQLVVSWDRNSSPVLEALGGVLEIVDAGSSVRLNLDGNQLRSGSLTYARKSDRVELRMVLPRKGAPPVEETVSFIGQPSMREAQAAGSPAQRRDQLQTPGGQRAVHPERDEADAEVARLREALRKQTARNEELERAIRILRDRLQVEGARAGRP
jgi:proteasome lid subunit RPN8/RPN11